MANAIILEPLAMTVLSASSSASGFPASNAANDFIGVAWKSATGSASQTITIDLGADVAFDTAMMFGCVGAVSAWQLQVEIATAAQGSGFSGAWAGTAGDFLAGSAQPRSGRSKAIWLAPEGAPAAGRYVRFTISSLSSAAVIIGRIVIGKKIQLARNFQFGAAFGVQALGNMEFSVRGVPLKRSGAKQRAIGITFGHVHRDEVEEKIQPLLEVVGNDTPIALCTDPDASTQRQGRMYFGYLVGDIGTIWARANGFQAGINLAAVD